MAGWLLVAVQAGPLDQWHQRSPIAQGERLARITFGQGLFVAAGQAGEIQTSADGVNWTQRRSGTAATLNEVLATGNLFVAVGDGGTILTSADTESWLQRDSGTTERLVAVAYGNDRFMALGAHLNTNGAPQSVVATSVDGTNWTTRLIEIGGEPSDLEFGNGAFFAALMVSYGERALATSIDGLAWTLHAWPANNFPNRLTYGNGELVAVGGFCGLGGCSGSIVTSADGVSWTPAAFQPRFLQDVTFGDDQFVAVGGNCNLGGCDSLIVTSNDGHNWIPRSANARLTLTSVAFGNNTFVVLGENGLILQSDPLADSPPLIARQPLRQIVSAGSTVTLRVVAAGTSPLAYQWSKGNEPQAGATNATLVLNNVQLLDSGNYVVEVSNAFGSTNSIPAYLGVEPLGPLGNWHWRNPTPQGSALSSVVFGTNSFLAGGYGGFVLTSPNAVSWDLLRNDSIPGFLELAYGNGLFVGVTSAGRIAVSGDGLNWTNQDLGNGAGLSRVAFGRGLFVGVAGLTWPRDGRNTTILTSPDGVAWTPRDAGTTNVLYGVTYGQGIFLAVGEAGTVATSEDGLGWKAYTTETNITLEAVTFGENLFVAVGTGFGEGVFNNDPGLIITSRDGVDWTPGHFTSGHLHAVAWGNGVYVAVGGGCAKYGCNPELVSSNDGRNWTERSVDQVQDRFGNVFSALSFGQGTFVAVNLNGTILTSVDGVRWQARNDGVRWQQRMAGAQKGIEAVVQGADTLVAVGGYLNPYSSAALILSSTDGVNWTERVPPGGAVLYSVAFSNGTFVAAGAEGTLFTSANGVDWVPHVVADGARLGGVRYAASRFVASSGSFDTQGNLRSSIWTSEDGERWVEQYFSTNVWLFSFAYGNGLFVAASGTINQQVQQARLLTSSDGLAWTPRAVPGTGLSDIAFGNGLFVATGSDCDSNGCWRVVLTSTNGLTWAAHSSRYDPLLTRLAFGRGYFMALGDDNSLYFSTDGVHWIIGRAGGSSRLYSVGFGLNTFWAVGDNGAILQSDPLSATPPSIAREPFEQVVLAGTAASLQVTAIGSSPLSYQWLRDGAVINGATNATLAFRQVGLEDDGNYFVVVSNPVGAAVTQPVHLTVQTAPEAPELSLELDPSVELTLVARPGRIYEIQSVDNLQDSNAWKAVTRLQLPAVPFTWTDTQSPPSDHRFYRAVLLP